jgi:CubicO group peptidase (beta-lactamase class C family)
VFGYRDYISKETLDTNSVFELASVSKQFTAMGILLLAEKRKLKLTDDLQKYFPELPYKGITIHNLLVHNSGLPDYINIMTKHWDHKKVAFNNDAIEMLAQQKPPANFLPGERFQYSNTGYMLLASIIEKVSGKSFKNYMDEAVFKPLGMQHTRVYNTRRSEKEVIPNYAYGFTYSQKLQEYVLPDSIPELNLVYFLDGIQGDGIINSTASDLLKWDRALKNNQLISKAMQDKMFTKHIIADSASQAYYGFSLKLILRKSFHILAAGLDTVQICPDI